MISYSVSFYVTYHMANCLLTWAKSFVKQTLRSKFGQNCVTQLHSFEHNFLYQSNFVKDTLLDRKQLNGCKVCVILVIVTCFFFRRSLKKAVPVNGHVPSCTQPTYIKYTSLISCIYISSRTGAGITKDLTQALRKLMVRYYS